MSDQMARDVQALIALFSDGGWTELRVESAGLSLLISNNSATPSLEEKHGVASPRSDASTAASAPAPAALPPAPVADANIDPSWAVVAAPNLGTFYRAPKPGAAPFVEVGQVITADSDVCLIEVMKLFTSVKAGVAGAVRKVAAEDGALVDGGQVLMYIETT